MRNVTPEDLKPAGAAPASAAPVTSMKEGTQFLLGTLFQTVAGSAISMLTAGNYYVMLQGDGQFVFEDARINDDRNAHTAYWFVKKGTFRAKPYEYDPNSHYMEVRTASASIFLEQAEIGMNVYEGGSAQVWLVSGKGHVVWNDGRRKELPLKGMDYL